MNLRMFAVVESYSSHAKMRERSSRLFEVCVIVLHRVYQVSACVCITETVPGEAVAKFDYAGRSEKELSFHKGDVLQVAQHMSKDWWKGSLHGRMGLIPAGYVDVRYALNYIAISHSKLLSN